MYAMAHDSPECAAAVWGRRIGFFLNAHGKRLRDAELEQDEDFTAWPSTGVWMVLRAMGHIFPVTDMRHPVVTPAMLLLGQMIAHTPIYSMNDLVMASLCCGLLIEYSKDAKRVVPEALSFLASMVRMFSLDSSDKDLDNFTLPSLGALAKEEIADLRELASAYEDEQLPLLSLEKDWIEGTASEVAAALLVSTLHMIEVAAVNLTGSLSGSEKECFSDIAESLLVLKPKSKRNLLPSVLQTKAAAAVASVSKACASDANRAPLQRRARLSVRDSAVKSLAPRLENPDRYSFSKDKNKKAEQAALDRTRREFKREHKSVSRELRLDSQFFEAERRQQKDKVDSAAKNKRQRAFAWLEGEQAAMNQQVRQGGGLLQGGGMGAAKMKARSGKIGMKKGGKLK
jgi:nucleolar protein 14